VLNSHVSAVESYRTHDRTPIIAFAPSAFCTLTCPSK
jgi:hypothetical protein